MAFDPYPPYSAIPPQPPGFNGNGLWAWWPILLAMCVLVAIILGLIGYVLLSTPVTLAAITAAASEITVAIEGTTPGGSGGGSDGGSARVTPGQAHAGNVVHRRGRVQAPD